MPPCTLGWQRTWGLAGACQGALAAAAPGPNCWQLAKRWLGKQICRVLATQLTTYLFEICTQDFEYLKLVKKVL
jgi:hypothetical protein